MSAPADPALVVSDLADPAMREKHGGADEHGGVRVWLRLLSCAMTIEKELGRRFAAHDTTLPRFDVLAALDRAPDGLTMGALSRALLVSNGNVTGLVGRLGEEGLVASRPSATDRRASVVRLTDAGRDRFATLAARHRGWIEDLLSGVPDAERDRLHDALGTLKTSIAREVRRP